MCARLCHRRLSYEAYTEMAIKLMAEIAEEAISKFGVRRCVIAHRIGFVAVCQSSLLVACSGAHRREPHDSVMYCVNQVKARVPVWKKVIPRDKREERPISMRLPSFSKGTEENYNSSHDDGSRGKHGQQQTLTGDDDGKVSIADVGHWSTKSEAFWLKTAAAPSTADQAHS